MVRNLLVTLIQDFLILYKINAPTNFNIPMIVLGVFGGHAVRVEKPEDIAPAIEKMLANDQPFLIDLVLEGDSNPGMVNSHCS